MTEEELQNIAKQLSCPQGEEGIQVGVQMNDSNFEMTLQTLNRTQFESGDKVLELGHGNGGHLPTLLSRADNLTYDGLEISTVMQAQAQLLNANLVHDEVTKFHLYDGMFIPFPENTFQKIFTVNTIYFWKKPKVLLVEIFRVLQKEGHFSLAFATKEFMKDLPFVQYGFRLW
ncbi:MAG: class I SAM-dependent methyltransferase, partial [Bacteroidota bacterium]